MADTQTITTTTQPFAQQLAFLQPGFQASLDEVLNRPQQYFPNSTAVPFSNQTQQALGGIEQRAMAGSPLVNAAQNSLMQTLGGAYTQTGPQSYLGNQGMPMFNAPNSGIPTQQELAGKAQANGMAAPNTAGMPPVNPYLQNVANSVQSAIQPGIDSTFAASGRGASGSHLESLQRSMANAVAPYAFSNYENERNRQLQAAQMAPALANQDYYDLEKLQGVGQAREQQAGLELTDSINRFNFNQQEPYNRVAQYMGLINGNYGQQSSQTSPLYNNTGANALGGALLGGKIGNDYFGGNGALGAGLGALAGLFF